MSSGGVVLSVGCGGSGCWSAWRLLLLPARPAFASLGGAGVRGLGPGLAVDGVVVADDLAAFVGGEGAAVGVADRVGLAGAPAGRDPGQQDGGDVADRGVVVPVAGHQPGVLCGQLGVALAGAVRG